MDLLPVFMNIRGRGALVVGGGEVAARKAALLLEAGAKVTVVAPELGGNLDYLAEQGEIEHIGARFEDDHLTDCALVIAATDDQQVNEQVSELAKARNIPVNVVDNPDLCTFVMPSIIDRSPVQIAVSTGGASPVLARLLRARLESTIPSTYGRLAQLVGLRQWRPG